ncbi:MAG: AAA domain-containing protein [Flavobacteriales bacterium]|nr:AAA domain-containing protein [Flavobacteriales bacterium]
MEKPEEELGALAQALVWEQREEEERLATLLKEHSLRFRKSKGLTWSPVSVEDQSYTLGGRPSLVLQKGANGGLERAFRVGAPVSIYQANEAGQPDSEGPKPRRGIVRKIRKGNVEVVLDGEPLSASEIHGRWTLDARGDDRTFFVMSQALSQWINVEDEHRKIFRDSLLGLRPVERTEELNFEGSEVLLSRLNQLQIEWIREAWNRPSLALLYGPPGTGKTTTLLTMVEGLVKAGERVLLTAPSNAAVDLLVLGCAARNMKVVRIGHPMRLSDQVSNLGLDAQVQTEADFKQVKELRKRASQSWSAADRFRRNFGPSERQERTNSKREARDLEREARDLEDYIANRILRKSQVICSTLIGSADSILRDEKFDVVVIDEAGQAMEPAVWAAMLKAPRAVLAGDPQQLPPVVKSNRSLAAGLGTSLLEKLLSRHKAAPWKVILEEQYRMHQAIMEPSSQWFYDSALKAHTSVSGKQLAELVPWSWIDTAGCGFEEEVEPEGVSTCNPEEARFVIDRLAELILQAPKASIGVVAPYRAQVQLLEELWLDRSGNLSDQLEFATVDAFQGQEKDAMVISLTRSNQNGDIGFLKDYRRTNVAMTRARMHLLMIGDGATLGADPYFAHLMKMAEDSGAYRSAWEWMS